MKKLVVTVLMIVFSLTLTAENVDLKNAKHGYSIIQQTDDYIILDYNVSSLEINDLNVDSRSFTEMTMESGYLTREIGAPASLGWSSL